MGIFDDELRRRMQLEESIRRTEAIDQSYRQSLFATSQAARVRALEITGESSAIADALKRSVESHRIQWDNIVDNARLAGLGGHFAATLDRIQSVETLKNIGRVAGLNDLAAKMAAPSIELQSKMAGVVDSYQRNFVIPNTAAITSLAESCFKDQRYQLSLAGAVNAMEAMKSPWLDSRRTLDSARALVSIQSIGLGANVRPFDLRFTGGLRQQLGDWREIKTLPGRIFEDPIARSDFYFEQGFDPALADFPEEAFVEATEVAGLVLEDQGDGFDFSHHERLYGQLVRVEYDLRIFVHQTMSAAFGENWIDRIDEQAKRWRVTRQKRLDEGQPEQPLLISYSELSDLQEIMQRKDHFPFFKPVFRRVESMQETFRRLLPARHAVAHCGIITQVDVITVLAESVRLRSAIRS